MNDMVVQEKPLQSMMGAALALDIAMRDEGKWPVLYDDDTIMKSYGLSRTGFDEIVQSEFFKKKVEDFKIKIRDEGLAFKVKAEAYADDVLTSTYLITQDMNVAATTRLAAAEKIVRWAGRDGTSAIEGGNKAALSGIQIIIGGDTSKGVIIDGQAQQVPS